MLQLLILLGCCFFQTVKEVEKAILGSPLRLNPILEGQVLKVPIPKYVFCPLWVSVLIYKLFHFLCLGEQSVLNLRLPTWSLGMVVVDVAVGCITCGIGHQHMFCLALVLYRFNFKTDKSVTEKFFCRSSQAL
jgi:hypothetical protein